MSASGLYTGKVTHARRGRRRHRLAYRVFMLLLDLDELPALDRRLRMFAADRFALTSFRQADHLSGGGPPLKAQVQALLEEAGLPHGGAVRVLCMPRLLGAAFNPLTVYFCQGPDGAPSAVLYEVNNTFGERGLYLLAAGGEQTHAKNFYVSPFMDMELTYRFRTRQAGDSIAIEIDAVGAEGVVLTAGFHGARRELSDAALVRAWLSHPVMSLGVLWAIHWEALKIFMKGEPLRSRPPPGDAREAAAARAEPAAPQKI